MAKKRKTGDGFETASYENSSVGSGASTVSEEKNERKPLTKGAKLAIIIAAALAGAGLIVGLVFLIISLIPHEPAPRIVFAHGEFDYIILADDTVEIVDYHGNERNIRIPTVIENREVSSIGEGAFEGRTELLSVQLGGFVRRISDSAFAGCSTVSEIIIPQSVREIGDYAFHKCLMLKEISLPSALEKLGKGAFSSSGIVSFDLPVGISEVSDELFSQCLSLEKVELGEHIKSIGRSAFYGCKLIASLDLPFVESVGDSAFAECANLASITFGKNLSYVGEGVFYVSSGVGDSSAEGADKAAPKLASITVPAENTHFTTEGGALVSIDDARLIILPPAGGVKSYSMPSYIEHVSDYAFGGNESIEEIVLSPVLKTVGYGAFHTTLNLARISLPTSAPEASFDFPASLTEVGGNAFVNSRCYAVLKDEFTVIGDGILVKYFPATDDQGRFVKTEHTTPDSDKAVTVEVVIPDGVKSIASAFSGQSSVTRVTGSPSLVKIEEYSFYNCGIIEVIDLSASSVSYIGDFAFASSPSIKTVLFPETLTEVGDSLFFSCYGLESITLPESLTRISEKMFADCIALKSVSLGSSVEKIGIYAFYGATSLAELRLPASLKSIGDYALAKTGIVEFLLPANVEVGTGLLLDAVELKEITIFGDGATPNALCMGATGLESVKFVGNPTRIGDECFFNCTALVGMTLPDSVSEIGDYAFSNCSSLEYIRHSGKLTYLGAHAFHMDGSLSSFEFPETLKSVGAYAFSNCSSLASADLRWVENIGRNAFENCTLLKKLDLRRVAYTVPAASFAWCTSLTEVQLADTVTYIGEAAFINCNLLKSVKLPGELVTIGASAFQGCKSLSDITWGAKLETIGSQAFSECDAITSLSFPSSLRTVMQNAFENCKELAEVNLNEELTTLGDYSFAGCISLLNIRLPESLEIIPVGCFTGSALVDVRAGSRVKKICTGAFAGCSLLEIFEVGNLLATVEDQAFDYCENFRYFMYDGGEMKFAAISIGEGNDYMYAAYQNYLRRQ